MGAREKAEKDAEKMGDVARQTLVEDTKEGAAEGNKSDTNTLDENLLNDKEIMQHIIGGKDKHLEQETTPVRKKTVPAKDKSHSKAKGKKSGKKRKNPKGSE